MLTESEKEKIKLEEIFRNEVRKELEIQKEKNFSFWSFLNSGFTLFILSSVVIGGISFLHNEWRDHQIEDQRIKTKKAYEVNLVNKLSEEILVRLNAIEQLNDTIPEYKSKNVLVAYWGNSIKEDESLNLKYYHLRPLFTEYEKMTLLELLTELNRYSDDETFKIISKTRKMIINKAEELNGGVYVLSKTKDGSILQPGKLYRPNKSKPNIWIFKTTMNKVIQLSEDQLPLTNYYTAARNQRKLVKLIHELKLLLTKNKM